MNDDLSSSDVNKLGKEKSLKDYGYEIDPNSMYGWKNYYFIQSLPIRYENLLKESSFRELNRKLEYSIRKTGDEMNRETNVQADMTDYKTHLSNIHFKTLGNKKGWIKEKRSKQLEKWMWDDLEKNMFDYFFKLKKI